MSTKTEQLQIRVTPRQKAMLKRRASAAGLDVSSFVLGLALPEAGDRVDELLRMLRGDEKRRYALAELNDFLHACPASRFADAVNHVNQALLGVLSPYVQNLVAAMIEQAAQQKGEAPPAWTRDIAPLDVPHFATPFASLRPHLLRAAPVAFKRRNIFVDSGVGDRV